MKRDWILVAASLLILSALSGCKGKKTVEIPPPKVIVVEVEQRDVPIEEEFVGQTYGLFDISIQARVEGFLESLHFEEGRRVKKGQLLYTIDSQPFEANVSSYRSHLAEVKTFLTKAESDLARIQPLAEMNAVSQSDLDAALAQRDAAAASVEAAEASLRAAQIELGYTRIYSPIDGIIGKTEAHPGDFVGRGATGNILNEVSRIDTILVNFHLPEEQYMRLSRPFLQASDSVRAKLKASRASMELLLADGSLYEEKGKIRFVNRQVNATTGTILLQAAFSNPDFLLRPGQFARVRVVTNIREDALLVPQRCVREIQGSYSVFVVDEDNTAQFRQVEVGETVQPGMWLISSGLEAGEKVIYEGLLQVSSGVQVQSEQKEL